jgi:hypothetical protein
VVEATFFAIDWLIWIAFVLVCRVRLNAYAGIFD